MRKWAVFALVPLLLFSLTPINQHDFSEIGEFNPAYRSASQPAPFVLDSFESLNASDDSVVMSLDERNGKLAGCAQFSGTINGLNQPGAQVRHPTEVMTLCYSVGVRRVDIGPRCSEGQVQCLQPCKVDG